MNSGHQDDPGDPAPRGSGLAASFATTSARRADGCASDYQLDLLVASALDEARETALRAHLAGCEVCAARFGEIERDRDAFRALPPAVDLAAAETPARAMSRWRWLLPALGAAAAAALIVLVIVPARPAGEPGDAGYGTRTKGGVRLGLYVDHGGARPGQPGEIVYPGDAIRFTYFSREPGYLAVLSVDGGGRVSVYHPEGDRAEAIAPGDDVALPGSIVLDDVLGQERIYGLFCSSPVALSPIVASLEAGGELRPPPACAVDTWTLDKRRPE